MGPGGEKIEQSVTFHTERHVGSDISSRVTFQGAKVRKPLLAVSQVIDKGDIVVFDGSGSFILPNSCAGVAYVRKAITGSWTHTAACEKWSLLLADVGTRGQAVDGFQSAGSPLKGPSTRLSKLGPPVRPLKEKELGPFGELSTSNPWAEVTGVSPEVAPNVSARGADDVDMGDEVAQRGVSDAESVGVMNFGNLDDGTARLIQRPGKLRTLC